MGCTARLGLGEEGRYGNGNGEDQEREFFQEQPGRARGYRSFSSVNRRRYRRDGKAPERPIISSAEYP